MEDAVDCAECGGRYDSQEHAFCPRCGSTRTAGPLAGAPAIASRLDPRRRRVRMVGVLLLVAGSMFAVLAAPLVVSPPQEADPAMLEMMAGTGAIADASAGGTVLLTVTDGGQPAAGVPVRALHRNGSQLAGGMTDANGSLALQLPAPFANVTVGEGEAVWIRHVYAPAGARVAVPIDRASAPAGEVAWESAPLTTPMRVMAAFLVFFALVVAGGGWAAMRQRRYPLALGGALIATSFTLLLLVGFPHIYTGINAALFVAATVVVVRARPLFTRAA